MLPEACRHILLRLDRDAVATMRMVDHQWKRVADDHLVWWSLCQEFENSKYDLAHEWKMRFFAHIALKRMTRRLVELGKDIVDEFNSKKCTEYAMVNMLLDDDTAICIYPDEPDDIGHLLLNQADVISFHDTKALHLFWQGNPELLARASALVEETGGYTIEPNETSLIISRPET